MDTMFAKYDQTETSWTPLRRSTLLRREMARERVAKRIREKILTVQMALSTLLGPTDPRHVIETGNYEDDLRGMVNPDGSIHVWPLEQESHVERAHRLDLLDEWGNEGTHFYVWLGRDDQPSGCGLLYVPILREEVATLLNYWGILKEAASRSPYYGDDDADHVHDREPHPWSYEVVIAAASPPFIKVAAASRWKFTHNGWTSFPNGWSWVEAWNEADKRNRQAEQLGIETRYMAINSDEVGR